jgi:glutamyl-tRNA reductase
LEISSAGFSYPEHDGADRAWLAGRLVGVPIPPKTFVLSTCLRVEVTVAGDPEDLDRALKELFGDLPEGLLPQVRDGQDAVGHLFRIAAGLESPILGEQEILTQFRQAVLRSEEIGTADGLFARLLEKAVSAGRQARDLMPGSPHNSMAAVAAQLLGSPDRVAVIGSGIMATAVVENLLHLPVPPSVTVVARRPEKVQPREGVEVWPFVEARRALSEFAAVVSATSAKTRLIDEETMAEALSQRGESLTLIDMAMPPDFRPPDTAEVTYFDIDDLARMADRRPRAKDADEYVESAAADAYRQYRDHHAVGPLIAGLMSTADDIVDHTVARFAGRLETDADRAVLRQAVHTAARKLLAGPVSYVKQAENASEAIGVIADAFGVEDD